MDVVALATVVAFAAAVDTTTCFRGVPDQIVNPGTSGAYLIQYHFPFNIPPNQRVQGFAFMGNDDQDVYPSAGIVSIEIDSSGTSYRFPTPAELQNLQRPTIPQVADTTIVVVRTFNDVIPIEDKAIVIVLELPPGTLDAIGDGPGVVASHNPPGRCSYYTLDDGQTWFQLTEHDWAFALLFDDDPLFPTDVPLVPRLTWTAIKKVYR